jgi:hypothetical protein
MSSIFLSVLIGLHLWQLILLCLSAVQILMVAAELRSGAPQTPAWSDE